MYLENGDEVIEADNGRLILANSGVTEILLVDV